jgi:hypothetical protein
MSAPAAMRDDARLTGFPGKKRSPGITLSGGGTIDLEDSALF